MPSRSATNDLIWRLFVGVVDKAGAPYATHCERVAAIADPDVTEDGWHAAMLHDVLEDTGTTADDLRGAGYSERTVRLVERLTRDKAAGSYAEWIAEIAASGDRELITVKLADNADNMDPARVAALPEALRKPGRYEDARRVLLAGLRQAGLREAGST